MKYGYTMIYVDDVPSVLNFYSRAFGFEIRFLHESKAYGELNTGDTVLAFASHALMEANLPAAYVKTSSKTQPFGIEIAFVTDEVEQALARALEAGAIEIAKPKAKPWGQVVAHVRSIEGTLIEICSPVAT